MIIMRVSTVIIMCGQDGGDGLDALYPQHHRLAGLELALDRQIRKLTVHSDSELVCRQLTGRYKVKDANMRGYHSQATALLEQFQEVEIKCIRREENAPADRLVNEALDAAAR